MDVGLKVTFFSPSEAAVIRLVVYSLFFYSVFFLFLCVFILRGESL